MPNVTSYRVCACAYLHASPFQIIHVHVQIQNCFNLVACIMDEIAVHPLSCNHLLWEWGERMRWANLIISVDLIRHDHHPQEEDCSNEHECPSGSPTLAYREQIVSNLFFFLLSTYSYSKQPPPRNERRRKRTDTILHQPTQRVRILPRHRSSFHVEVTRRVHSSIPAPQLYRDDNQTYDPEDKKDEWAYDHNARKKLTLGDEEEEDEDEEDREAGDCDPVGEIPVQCVSFADSNSCRWCIWESRREE